MAGVQYGFNVTFRPTRHNSGGFRIACLSEDRRKNAWSERGGVAGRHAWKKQKTTEEEEERDWKKVRGKVSTVFHSAGSARFQALETAAAAAEELVIIGLPPPGAQTASPGSPKDSRRRRQGELRLLAIHRLFVKHFDPTG